MVGRALLFRLLQQMNVNSAAGSMVVEMTVVDITAVVGLGISTVNVPVLRRLGVWGCHFFSLFFTFFHFFSPKWVLTLLKTHTPPRSLSPSLPPSSTDYGPRITDHGLRTTDH